MYGKVGNHEKNLWLFLIVFEILIIMGLFNIVNAGPIDINLLDNPGFESNLDSWTTDHGAIRSSDPLPHSGNKYLMGAIDGSPTSYTYQTIDLVAEGFSTVELDSELFLVKFGGWQSGWHTQTDSGKIEIILKDESLLDLSTLDLGWFYSNNTWAFKEGYTDLLAGTRFITYGFYAQRYQTHNTEG